MATVSHNIIANFAGRGWTMLIGVAFVPIYLRFLGIEAYGLIGFFLTLQSVFGIMDLGLSLTLNRELARASSHEGGSRRMASLLRTMEVVYWLLSVVVGVVVVVGAPWIAESWVNTVTLSTGTVQNAVRMMGIIIALQAPFALYQGGLTGLQQQVSVNLILALAATVRAAGAALVLWLLSPTVEAYFAWQVFVAGAATGLCAWRLWQAIPGGPSNAHFAPALLGGVHRFALAVSANAIVGMALTQLDKLILIRLLPLAQFGYYMLATLVGSLLWAMIVPINTALFPRFVELHGQQNEIGLTSLYHKACELLAVILIPTVLVLSAFSYDLLLLWTGDEIIAGNSYLLVVLLGVGNGLNGLASVGGILQSAAGWPGLVLRTNLVLVCLVVPTLFAIVPRYGAVGAACVWIGINAAYLFCTIPIMHTRLIKTSFLPWLLQDVLLPLSIASVVVLAGRALYPGHSIVPIRTLYAFLVWCLCVLVTAAAMPYMRGELRLGMKRIFV